MYLGELILQRISISNVNQPTPLASSKTPFVGAMHIGSSTISLHKDGGAGMQVAGAGIIPVPAPIDLSRIKISTTSASPVTVMLIGSLAA